MDLFQQEARLLSPSFDSHPNPAAAVSNTNSSKHGQRVAGAAVLILSLLWRLLGGPTHVILFVVGVAASFLAGAAAYLAARLYFSPRFSSSPALPPKSALEMQEAILEDLRNKKGPEEQTAPHITRNIDSAINEIIDLVSRDYVLYWVRHLMPSDRDARAIFKRDFWVFVNNFSSRMARVDTVKLLATDVVKKVADHFEKIRLVQYLSQQQHQQAKFPICPHLVSAEREVEYLAKVAEVLIILLCREDYGNCTPIRHMLREVLSRHVLSPLIDLITDPEYINTKILSYIKKHQSLRELSRKTFVYADSFEEFVSLIDGSSDIDELKQIRYNVLTEIMQATTMDNLRKAKRRDPNSLGIGNVDDDEDDSSKKAFASGAESSAPGGDLTRYLAQLLHAKGLCERRLAELGCDVHFRPAATTEDDQQDAESSAAASDRSQVDLSSVPSSGGGGGRRLSFRAVLNSASARRHFHSYLEEEGHQELLSFWSAVQELKEAHRTQWHSLATEIFYKYINKQSETSLLLLQVDRSALKRVESFLMGDSEGPEVFFELQGRVQESLRETYFPAFLLSAHCSTMMVEDDYGGDKQQKNAEEAAEQSAVENDDGEVMDSSSTTSSKRALSRHSSSDVFSGHSGMAKTHLGQIREKLQNKLQAMAALRTSLKPDSRILQTLQQEVDALGSEETAVESHLERTESWASNLGQWRCQVQSLEYGGGGGGAGDGEGGGGSGSGGGAGGDSALRASLVTFVPEGSSKLAGGGPSSSSRRGSGGGAPSVADLAGKTSWTCVRKISDFHQLHRDLTPFVSWSKSVDLPSQSKSIFLRTPNSKAALEKARHALQKFVDLAMDDDQVNQSEVLYAFLSPTPAYLKAFQQLGSGGGGGGATSPRTNKTSFPSLSNFFKSDAQQQQQMLQHSHHQSLSTLNASSLAPSSLAPIADAPGSEECGSGSQGGVAGSEDGLFDEFDTNPNRAGGGGGGQADSEQQQQQKDVIAESLYRLIGEVFDMRGVFKLLRKSLMTFVQITYGSTINRQIRDTVSWLTCEQMILYYLSSFRKAYWQPGGQIRQFPAQPDPESEEAREKRVALAAETREALVHNIPEVLVNLVGQHTAINGTVKVFEALQNATLNKQLLYSVLEMVMCELFPELTA